MAKTSAERGEKVQRQEISRILFRDRPLAGRYGKVGDEAAIANVG